jgi:hypothetical protein
MSTNRSLSGDVHLAAVGQFYSNPKWGYSKDTDHRYMVNVISSAIVNAPPAEMVADLLNKRNKVHHLDVDTYEDMIPLFTHDVDGKPRNNKRLLQRRNFCAIREYFPGDTPPPTPPEMEPMSPPPGPRKLSRTLSLSRRDIPENIFRRNSKRRPTVASPEPPQGTADSQPSSVNDNGYFGSHDNVEHTPPPNPFRRRLSQNRKGGWRTNQIHEIDLQEGLDICLNLEVSQHDPAGITTPYHMLVPALAYDEPEHPSTEHLKKRKWLSWRRRNPPQIP